MSDFRNSKTKDNLMRAFAGESQARNRYTMAEEKARQQKLYVLADLFKFTANQEKVHAKILYEHLKELFRRICVPCLVWQTTTSVRNQTTFILRLLRSQDRRAMER